MTHGVTRLKELLFDAGDEDLSSFERRFEEARQRLKTLEDLSEGEKREREKLLVRLDEVYDQAGSHDHLVASVAKVLDEALTVAEVSRHDQLARALAPLVVQTIKTELKNSQDEMVEVFYPITGRMVKAYVASAIKDLTDQINAKLEQNAISLRMRSLVSGVSVADLSIADSQRLHIEEVFLIRRGSGALLARWPEGEGQSNRDIHLGGVLSAINDFATHAFESDGGSLRTFELDEFHVYLRASSLYLIAAKCRGIAPAGVEKIFDGAFLELLERLPGDDVAIAPATLQPLAGAVTDQTAQIYDRNARAGLGFNPLRLLVFLLAVPLFAWLIWWAFTVYEETRIQNIAQAIVSATSGLRGYPLDLDVGYRGRSIRIAGLLPDASTREGLMSRLAKALPRTRIEPTLGVLPQPEIPKPIDPTPEIAKLRRQLVEMGDSVTRRQRWHSLRRSLAGSAQRVNLLIPEFVALQGLVDDRVQRRRIELALSATRAVQRRLQSIRTTIEVQPEDKASFEKLGGELSALSTTLREATSRVESVLGGEVAKLPEIATDPDAIVAAEAFAAESHRASAMVLAVVKARELARRIMASLPEPPPPARPAPEPTPREKLEAFVKRHAIFFSNGTDFMDDDATGRTLDRLAALMQGNAVLVRVVGYTDETGGVDRNTSLSEERANAVMRQLVARGVSANRMVTLGRTDGLQLSSRRGAASPNRRVQFEIGFEGEARQ